MARLAVIGVILALALAPVAAMSHAESQVGAPPIPKTVQPVPPQPPVAATPVEPNVYRQPSYGYRLPGQWMSSSSFMPNYRRYRLPRPAPGFGWSRYYDDAVLTDRYGRVYDWRSDVDWSRDPYGPRNDGIAGAVIGGVVGGIAGNVIGGNGNRLAGTLIGGGVGALAGRAIDKSASRRRDRGYRHDGPSYPHWYPADADGRSGWMEGPTVTTTTTTPGKPIVTRTVRYVTEYVTVPARRTKYVKRTKDVRL